VEVSKVIKYHRRREIAKKEIFHASLMFDLTKQDDVSDSDEVD